MTFLTAMLGYSPYEKFVKYSGEDFDTKDEKKKMESIKKFYENLKNYRVECYKYPEDFIKLIFSMIDFVYFHFLFFHIFIFI